MPIADLSSVASELLPRNSAEASKPKRVSAATAWARVVEDIGKRTREGRTGVDFYFLYGADLVAPEIRPHVLAAAELAASTEAPTTWPVPATALLVANVPRAIDAVRATGGLAIALEVAVLALPYETPWKKDAAGRDCVVPQRTAPCATDLTLRAPVLAASPAEREEARGVARRLFSTATLGQKLTLAYTFFDERSWVDEVARAFVEGEEEQRQRLPVEALYATVDDYELARAVIAKRTSSRSYLEIARTFGDRGLDLVAEAFAHPRDEHDLKHAAHTLAIYDAPRAAELLVSGLGNVKVRPAVAAFCARFPERGRQALDPIARGKGRLAKFAAELCKGIDTAAAGAAVDGASGEEAGPDELPWILVRPPWLDRKKIPKRPQVRCTVPLVPRAERLTLPASVLRAAEESVDPALALLSGAAIPTPVASATEDERKTLQLVYTSEGRLPDDVILERWNGGGGFSPYGQVGPRREQRVVDFVAYIMTRFGADAIPGLALYLEHRHSQHNQHKGDKSVLLGVDSPRIAAAVAKLMADDGTQWWHDAWGPYARRWMRTFPETAVIGLVPAALAGNGDAERALRYLRDVVRVPVQGIAKVYGAEASGALESVLGWDARYDLPPRIAKLPPTYRPEGLTRPTLASGKRLPLSAMEHLGTMLSFSDRYFAYEGLLDVKRACAPRSLAEFAWDLARAWEVGGGKGPTEWMLDALVHFADDEVVRRTTPTMRSQSIGAVLMHIGTDAAVMELVTIAARASAGNKSYGWGARVADRYIARIASGRGVTPEELEDSVLPVRQVDHRGLDLDLGGRSIRVSFDEKLEAFVQGEDGGRLRGFPPTKKTDDKAKVEAAKRVWEDIREEVTAVIARRLVQLEAAMVRGRTWTVAQFRERYVDHPLLGTLAKTLIWEQDGTAFRITEDGGAADVDDRPFTLRSDGLVRLVHPARLPEDAVHAWGTVLADYEIVQPFQQIGRTVRALDAATATQRDFSIVPRERAPASTYSERLEGSCSFVDGTRTLTSGWAKVLIHYGPSKAAVVRGDPTALVDRVEVTFSPAWVSHDPLEMAEVLSDVAG